MITHLRGPLGLLAVAGALAAAGCLLLTDAPDGPGTARGAGNRTSPLPSAAPATAASGTASRAPSRSPADPPPPSRHSPAPGTTWRGPAPLPPPGEGPAGDRAVQQAMDRTSPRDLARADEKQLLRAGREVLAAEVTGRGRTRWNHYFPKEAAVHVYRRFRIQAAIARRDRSPERAVVHLVWAGTDRGGTHQAGRTASIRFVKEPARTKGDRSWAPTR